jgi:hypothetical protein
VRVAHKRDCREERGTTGLEAMTLYIGHSADLFRFYDKLAESRYRNGMPDSQVADPPLTRIERQLEPLEFHKPCRHYRGSPEMLEF